MQMMKEHRTVGIIVLVTVLLLAGALWQSVTQREPVAPAAPVSEPVATTSEPVTEAPISAVTVSTIAKFPIDPADTLVSWSFKGVYLGDAVLVAKANADMEHLRGLLGKGTYDDYDLYLGIGNDADLLGDGMLAYQSYNRSISIHPNKGLAYANLGHLMEELGAYRTAANAYAKAVAVEPNVGQYRTAQLDYLNDRFPDEAAKLQAK